MRKSNSNDMKVIEQSDRMEALIDSKINQKKRPTGKRPIYYEHKRSVFLYNEYAPYKYSLSMD